MEKRSADDAVGSGGEDAMRRDRIVFALEVNAARHFDDGYAYELSSKIAEVESYLVVEQDLGWEIGDILLMDLHLPGVGDEVLNDDGEPLEMG